MSVGRDARGRIGDRGLSLIQDGKQGRSNRMNGSLASAERGVCPMQGPGKKVRESLLAPAARSPLLCTAAACKTASTAYPLAPQQNAGAPGPNTVAASTLPG